MVLVGGTVRPVGGAARVPGAERWALEKDPGLPKRSVHSTGAACVMPCGVMVCLGTNKGDGTFMGGAADECWEEEDQLDFAF